MAPTPVAWASLQDSTFLYALSSHQGLPVFVIMYFRFKDNQV